MAFSATNSFKNSSEIVLFTEISLNKGNAYNSTTGHFVAPVTGLYLLSVQLCGALINETNQPSLSIIRQRNKRPITSSLVNGRVSYICATTISLSKLQANEIIYVVINNHEGVYGELYDSFTGLLVERLS